MSRKGRKRSSRRAEEGPRRSARWWQKLLLAVASTLLFVGLVEGGLALAGVEPRLYEQDPYVAFSAVEPLFVPGPGPGGTTVMRTAERKLRLFNPQSFPRDKRDGAYRIFCLGGSTTYGRPYDDRTSFCGWLRELLREADPDRRWEVVNAGGVSYASYRVAELMEELAGYEPDLFVVYTGHNEFLERRTYDRVIAMPKAVRGLGALAARTRLYAALGELFARLGRGDADGAAAPAGEDGGRERDRAATVLEPEVVTVLDDAAGPASYRRDDDLRARVLEHYRYNLARMVDIARSADAGLVFVTPAANLRDSSPFKSEHREGLAAAERERWEDLVTAGREALAAGDPAAAVEPLGAAAAIDPRHADGLFLYARALDGAGRLEEARRAYEQARDEDVCPLRALGPMPGIVREVAAERGVPVVDFVALVDRLAADGIPGRDLFLDHVHPTIAGNRECALAVFAQLEGDGVVRPAPGWGETDLARVVARVEGGIDAEAHGEALMKLSKVLAWAGKHEEARRLSLQAVDLAPGDGQVLYQAGLMAGLAGDAVAAEDLYRRSIEVSPAAELPRMNLGVLLQEQGRLPEAIAQYREAIRVGTETYAGRHRENLAGALLAHGLAEYQRDHYPAAIEALEEGRRLAPQDLEVVWALGSAHLAAGDPGKAAEVFAEGLRTAPEHPGLHNRVAVALAAAGRLDEAIPHFQAAVEAEPGLASDPEGLLAILERSGRRDEAEKVRRALAAGARAAAAAS